MAKRRERGGRLDPARVATIGAERLADIVVVAAERDPEIKRKLERLQASPDPASSAGKSLARRIRALQRRERFVPYHAAEALARELDELRSEIVELSHSEPRAAAALLEDFVHAAVAVLNRMDDSGGFVADVFRAAVADWGTVWSRVPGRSPAELAELVFTEFVDNDYGVTDGIIPAFADALGDAGLTDLAARFRAALERQPRAKRGEWDSARSMLCHGLAEIADARQDVDAYIEAARLGGDPERYGVEIAQRLLASHRAVEALEWVDRVKQPLHPEARSQVRIAILEELGRVADAQTERREWFEQTLDREYFDAWIERLAPAQRARARTKAVALAKRYDDPIEALAFLTAIGENAAAEQLVLARRDELDGREYGHLRTAANQLRDQHPLGAIVLYRALAVAVLEDTRRNAYRYAARDLARANALAERVTKWRGVPNREAFMRELRARHGLKYSFWPLLESSPLGDA